MTWRAVITWPHTKVEADAIRKGEHAAEVEDEAGNLTAQIEAFAVVNSRLQDAAGPWQKLLK